VARPDVFATKPTLTGERVRLVPLGLQHAEALHRFTTDPETRRLTGTHRSFAGAASWWRGGSGTRSGGTASGTTRW
jgi:hypothetical protein